MKYQALQVKLTKNHSRGLSLLGGYSYHVEKDERFSNELDNYSRQYSWQNPSNFGHRLTTAGAWEHPAEKGAPLSPVHPGW